MNGPIAFGATALLVFSRALQQQNVVGGHYVAAALTPMLIAAGEIAVVGAIVISGWAAWPWISAGGGVGAVGAMWLHRIWFRRHAPVR
ncbi:MAG: hypothetical protein VBE63_18280 [Lamprobacter sp.]|uniref:hypothetical protein n=1 Tax=Lamprobacter sp. TaxID=3100796 RepID=UPI002B261901|nr:hypothetical protein [Lamprobacter sp.]MEA3641863.1 hypothetical protein [Lamprobacter sp.]